MKKILITALLLAGITATAQVKVGTNPTTLATNAAGTADDANFQVEGETASGNKQFVILQNGRVGIGTTLPRVSLDVLGGIIADGGAGSDTRVSARGGTDGTVNTSIWSAATNGYVGTPSNHHLIVRTNNVDRMIVRNDGKVGIGTTEPGDELNITADEFTAFSLNPTAANGSAIKFTREGLQRWQLTTQNVAADLNDGSRAGNDLGFYRRNDDGSFIAGPVLFMKRQTGNVGIGDADPSEKLSVVGSIKMVDGNQGAGKLMVSDADGKATWTTGAVAGLDTTADAWVENAGNTVLSSGNVGIGTTTPAEKLSLAMSNTIGSQKILFNVGAVETSFIESERHTAIGTLTDMHFGTMNNRRMTIKNAGNVGIGTTNPTMKLHINGATNAESSLLITRNDGASNISSFQISPTGVSPNAQTSFLLGDASITTNVMTLKQNGNVGIGTTTPEFTLDLRRDVGTVNAIQMRGITNGNYIIAQRSAGTLAAPTVTSSNSKVLSLAAGGYNGTAWINEKATINLNSQNAWSATDNSTFINFSTTPNGSTTTTEKMRITGEGNVGIGTTTPAEKLSLAMSNTIGSQKILFNVGAVETSFIESERHTAIGTLTDMHFGTMNNRRMTIKNTGNVGIGTTAPGSKLAVVGLPVYADNTAAAALSVGDFYRTATGVVMVKY